MKQLDFAGPVAAMLIAAPLIGSGLVTAFSGPMVQAVGVGGVAMILFGCTMASLLFQLLTLCKHCGVKSTEEI